MQNHDFTQLEHDSSQPIVIPGQEVSTTSTGNSTNSAFMPESYQTAQSFRQSPSQFPFSSSVNSVNSQSHIQGSYQHQFINSNLRGTYGTSPSAGISSPRADPPSLQHRPSISEHGVSGQKLFQQSAPRPSLLTTKLASQRSVTQLPHLQQAQEQQQQQGPQLQTGFNESTAYGSSFRPSSLRNNFIQQSSSFGMSPQNASSFQPQPPFNRTANISIETPSTSQHFNASGSVNSYTPHHNTPSVVSNSYTSAPGSVPTLVHPPSHTSSFQGFNHVQRTQPTSAVATTSSYGDFSKPQSFTPQEFNTTSSFIQKGFEAQGIPVQHMEQNQQQQQRLAQHDPPPQSTQEPQSYDAILRQTEPDGTPVEHLNIVSHPVDDLLLILSSLLQKIIEANDRIHPHHYHNAAQLHQSNKYAGNVLAFHGRNVPAISIHAYLTRILKYCPVTNEVFLTLLVYFDRIAKRANAGNVEDGEQQPQQGGEDHQLFVMDSYNIHRLIIAGITVASKFFSDVFYKNSRYAKVGGLPLEELNHLELQFLLLTDFKLMIQIEEMQRYADLLLKFWKREQNKGPEQQQQQQQHELPGSMPQP